MEKCLLMIMNGSSLDLSVIGILGIKTQGQQQLHDTEFDVDTILAAYY